MRSFGFFEKCTLVKFRWAFFALLISLNRSRVHRHEEGWRTKHEGFIMLVPVIIRLMDVN